MKHLGYNFKKKPHGILELNTKHPLTVMAIPDLHFPYHHPDALKFLISVYEEMQPDLVICLGDEVDMAALSFHDKDPSMPSAKDEYEAAIEHLGDLYRAFPNMLVCQSNHTSRPFRVAHKAGLPVHYMKSYEEFLQAPKGWSWHDRIVINDVMYIHGDPKSGRNAAWAWMNENKMSTVIGHIHGHGGVQYSASPYKKTFALNAGCLIDERAMAFRYGAKYAHKATLGCGIIKSSEHAHFIPMEVR